MTLTPAYGRDYKNKASILADWMENKDFVLNEQLTTTYINKQDAETAKYYSFQVRYQALRKVALLEKKNGTWRI